MEKVVRINFQNVFNANRCEGDYREAVTKRAMKLLKNEGFKEVKRLGQGAFGDVVRAKSLQTKKKVAVKIIPSELRRPLETSLWPKFNHPNILPLLNMMTIDCFDFFVMPLHPKAMDAMLKQKEFTHQRTAFAVCVRWLQDVLAGLGYLHAEGVCHLDLKSNNVLITKDMKAVLIDFSCIDTTDQPIQRYGLVKQYRPPECWDRCHGDLCVKGVPFDMWSFGMLGLSALTGYWMDKQLKLMRIWATDLLPHLQRALEIDNFRCQVQQTFPNAAEKEQRLRDVLNLLRGTLRLGPEERPAASDLSNHRAFRWRSGIRVEVDSIWSESEREDYVDVKPSQSKADSANGINEDQDIFDSFIRQRIDETAVPVRQEVVPPPLVEERVVCENWTANFEDYVDVKPSQSEAETVTENDEDQNIFDNFIRQRIDETAVPVQQEFVPPPLVEEWVVCENWTANFEECVDEMSTDESITEKNEEKLDDIFDNFIFKMLQENGNSGEEETVPFPAVGQSFQCEKWIANFEEYADEKQSLVEDESTNEKDEAQEEVTFDCFISERLDKTGNCSKDGDDDDPPDEGNDRSEVSCTPMTPMTEDEPVTDQRRAGVMKRVRGWFRKKWAKVRRSA